MTYNSNTATIPNQIRANESHKQAVAFMENFHAKEGVDYSWIIDYAKLLWDERNAQYKMLDEKADSIIKYLGGGLGLFSLGVLAKVDPANAYLIIWALPAVICALLSLYFATKARGPNPVPTLPPVETATSYAEKEKWQADFLGKWHVACEDFRVANRDKVRLLEWGTWCYC